MKENQLIKRVIKDDRRSHDRRSPGVPPPGVPPSSNQRLPSRASLTPANKKVLNKLIKGRGFCRVE